MEKKEVPKEGQDLKYFLENWEYWLISIIFLALIIIISTLVYIFITH